MNFIEHKAQSDYRVFYSFIGKQTKENIPFYLCFKNDANCDVTLNLTAQEILDLRLFLDELCVAVARNM